MKKTIEEYVYCPSGVCSSRFTFKIKDDIIEELRIDDGCEGNLKGISLLLTGMNIDRVIEVFQGIECEEKSTSCPDQIACALRELKEKS